MFTVQLNANTQTSNFYRWHRRVMTSPGYPFFGPRPYTHRIIQQTGESNGSRKTIRVKGMKGVCSRHEFFGMEECILMQELV